MADTSKIAVGGHSYGAFMAANLLAHAPDLFACGIARSGAYNRSHCTLLTVAAVTGTLTLATVSIVVIVVANSTGIVNVDTRNQTPHALAAAMSLQSTAGT